MTAISITRIAEVEIINNNNNLNQTMRLNKMMNNLLENQFSGLLPITFQNSDSLQIIRDKMCFLIFKAITNTRPASCNFKLILKLQILQISSPVSFNQAQLVFIMCEISHGLLCCVALKVEKHAYIAIEAHGV